MIYFAALTAVLVALQLERERRGDLFGRAILKLMASTSFVGCGLVAGGWGSVYGRWVLIGLLLSWFGDAFLLSRRRGLFVGGLVSFLLAHVAYGVGFVTLGVDRIRAAGAGMVLAVIALAVGWWLLSRVESAMRLPVAAYIVVISGMVALGVGASFSVVDAAAIPEPKWLAAILLIAPLAFYLSDLAVARDRFVDRSFANRLWGLPLYYLAQVLFAMSAGLG